MEFERSDAVVSTRISSGRSLIMRLDDKRYFELDEVATRIWELLPDRRDAGQIAAALAEEFVVTADEVGLHVEAFLQALVDRKLVRLRAGGRQSHVPLRRVRE